MTGPEYLWAKIRSWHLTPTVLPADHGDIWIKALCGRYATASMQREPEPPNGEATCETCFRVRESRG